MSQRYYRFNLQETFFPMLSEQVTRTTLVASDGERETNSPQIAYCHNVMPSAYGLDSVAYAPVIAPFSGLPANLDFEDVRIIFGDVKSRIHLAWDSEGNLYSLLGTSSTWITLPATVPATGGAGFDINTVTVATVNGVSYICYSGIAVFTYNEVTNSLDEVTLAGLAIAEVLGVVASAGYLIAYTTEAVAWSSTIDPIDFVPSQVTGAGGGNVAGIAGDILFSVPHPQGFIIYTVANAIVATFTGNSSYPFKFREVDSSKGGISLDLMAYEANSNTQFIYSKAGLQSVTTQKAESILPEVTDFLAGRRFEDFDETTMQFLITDITTSASMKKKLKFISSRYLVISYGLEEFTHALVYDAALNKLGKLKYTHSDVFEYIGEQTEISKENIAFVLRTGEVRVLDFSSVAVSDGLLLLGKVQYASTRMTKLLGVELENIEDAAQVEVYDLYTMNGKDTSLVQGVESVLGSDLATYNFLVTAKNHSILIKGKFNLTAGIVRYATAGRR